MGRIFATAKHYSTAVFLGALGVVVMASLYLYKEGKISLTSLVYGQGGNTDVAQSNTCALDTASIARADQNQNSHKFISCSGFLE